LPERDTAKLALLQNSKDHCLREAGDRDGPDLIAREHFGGIAGIPDINGEWPKPFCRTESIRGLGIRAAHKRQQTLDLVGLGKLDLVERQQNLQVFLDGLLAMEADNFARADAGCYTASQFLGSFEISFRCLDSLAQQGLVIRIKRLHR
jgi:hypothetical protein